MAGERTLRISILGDSSSAQEAFSGIGDASKTAVIAVAAIGAAVAAAGAGLYAVGSTFDDVSDTIRVTTGATGDALAELEQSAKNVGLSVPAEFEDIGSTIADVNQRMGLTGPTLEKVASQYLEAGRILGEEVDIDATSKALNIFGVTGENVSAGLDNLYQVSQATGIGINDLAGLVQSAGPAFQELGFSFEDTTALIGGLDKAGVNAQGVVAAMGKGLVNLAKDGEEPQEAFKRVTGEIGNLVSAGNGAAAIDLASGLFGTKGATQFVAALQSGALNMEDLQGGIGMTSDTILQAGADTADFSEQLQLFKNNVLVKLEPIATKVFGAIGDAMAWIVDSGLPKLERFGSFLGDKLAPIFSTLTEQTTRWYNKFENVFYLIGDLIGGTDDLYNTFSDIAYYLGFSSDAIDVFATVMTKVTEFIQNNGTVVFGALAAIVAAVLVPALIGWATAAAAAAAAQIAAVAPILAVLAVIGLLVGAVIYAYQHFEGFRTVINNVATFLRDTVWPIVQNFLSFLQAGFEKVVAWVQANWPTIQNAISNVMGFVKGVIETALNVILFIWESVGGSIINVVQGAFNMIKGVIEGVMTFIGGIIQVISNVLTGNWGAAWEGVKNILSGAVQVVFSIIGGIGSTIGNILAGLGTLLWNVVSGAFGFLVNAVRNGLNAAIGLVTGWGSSLWGAISGLGSTVANAASGMFDGIKTAFKGAINWLIGKWNGLEFRVPRVEVLGVGFGGFTIGVPDIPYLATGGTAMVGGMAVVGEAGPELVDLKPGARVTPLTNSQKVGGGGMGDTYVDVHVTTNADPWEIGNEVAWKLKTAG